MRRGAALVMALAALALPACTSSTDHPGTGSPTGSPTGSSAGSSALGHHTSSMPEKSCAGHPSASTDRALPTSQVKA